MGESWRARQVQRRGEVLHAIPAAPEDACFVHRWVTRHAADLHADPARIAVVVADRPKAFGLERARRHGVPTEVVLKRDHPDRASYDRALAGVLKAHGVQWVCLAGFMKLIGAPLLEAFPDRILNIHPALLPAFPGLHGAAQAYVGVDRATPAGRVHVHEENEGDED